MAIYLFLGGLKKHPALQKNKIYELFSILVAR
jgi:hypothetical protein